MSHASSPRNPAFDGLDFELTDFDTARAALDDPPPGINEVQRLKPGFWNAQRRKPMATDRALAGSAMDWVMGLTPGLRPRVLCERFPRIANALAACWLDERRCLAALDDLIVDRRGGRVGFPAEVVRELQALREFRARIGSG